MIQNTVKTIINSLSVFKDFGQHSRWISPDNIDYYKSRCMVSISKSSSGSPIHFQFQSANTGSTLTSHEVAMHVVRCNPHYVQEVQLNYFILKCYII